MITERKELMMKTDDMARLRRKKSKHRVFPHASFPRAASGNPPSVHTQIFALGSFKLGEERRLKLLFAK